MIFTDPDVDELRAWADKSARELTDREWAVIVRHEVVRRADIEAMMACLAREEAIQEKHLRALLAYLDEVWDALEATQRGALTAIVDRVCAELPVADAQALNAKHLVGLPIGRRGGNVLVPSSALGRAVLQRARSRGAGRE